jgi:glycerophosphoryl diester phosphodiesterase/predicted neuraminidase
MKSITLVLFLLFVVDLSGQQGPESELIFPLQEKHVHSSSIVELPNGDLLTCWFEGSGERTANDVLINGSRLNLGESFWSEPFLMADTPGQPDCNPILFLNNNNKLFLVWIAVQANRWERSHLMVLTSSNYTDDGAPVWEWKDLILLKPGEEFAERAREQFEASGSLDLAWAEYALPYEEMLVEAAKDPKKRETGWMPRTHPTVLKNGKILLPLYSDGFNFGLIAISEDDGETWECSLPIVGRGLNQPSLVVRTDGSIDAYMRDDGDEPGRIMISHSEDEGYSWTYAQKSDIPNPGASVEVIKLISGNWLLVYNDVDDGRYSLSAAISDDQGRSWKWQLNLEYLKNGSFSYPSVIQAKDGRIHITYSYHLPGKQRSIKHLALEEAWIMDDSNNESGKEISLKLEAQLRFEDHFPPPKNGLCYVIAHRGAHKDLPENSLAAYQKAIDLGCDFIEIDVRSSKDGKIVSIHNSSIDAYANGLRGKVSDFTLAELKALDIGIPGFEEILLLCRGKIGIYLDLKEPLVPELVGLIKEYDMERDILWYIPAYFMKAITDLKRLCPDCLPMPDPGPKANIANVATKVQPTVIATDMGQLNEEYMQIARENHSLVFVDEDKGDEAEWTQILEWGTDGIQTDNPEELIEFLKNKDFNCKTTSIEMPDRGICAHRGAMETHPENTLAAFKEAVHLGAQMIEFDVRMSSDGHLLILHDETVDRTSNGQGKISELSLEEVKQLDAGSWKSKEFAGETIPTFKEALALMPAHIWLNVHIKGGEELGKKVARVIVDENREHQAFLACGSEAARGAKKISRDIMICNMERQDERSEYIDKTIRQKSQFIQLLESRTDQDMDQEIARLKKHNIRINYCCTNTVEDVEALFNSGVDFILTDRLSAMLEEFEK